MCDKGGECPLQDNAYAYGPGESRFVEEKRHFEKPIPISDLVYLDRERCILCDRCTRFANEVAGDPLISFINRGSQTEVNTFPDHPFASYFSGNTVQICPVGALLARPFRFKARPWDLDKVESTCTSCAVGCRVTIEESRNHVLRYQGVDVDPVNWGWLCDKGRFDFEGIESDERLSEPLIRKRAGSDEQSGELIAATWAEALGAAAEAIAKADPAAGRGARRRPAHERSRLRVGEAGQGRDRHRQRRRATRRRTARRGGDRPAAGDHRRRLCAEGGTVIVASGDMKEELPVLFLRLRDAVVNRKVKVIELQLRPPPGCRRSRRCRCCIVPANRTAPWPHSSEALVRSGPATATSWETSPPLARCSRRRPVTAIIGRQSRGGVGRLRSWRAAALLLECEARRPLPRRARGAPTSGVRSTSVWRPVSYPDGCRSTTAVHGSPNAGRACRASEAWTQPASSWPRPTDASTCSSCSDRIRSGTFPTTGSLAGRIAGARTVIVGRHVRERLGATGRRRARGRRLRGGRRHDHQHRGSYQQPGPEGHTARHVEARLDVGGRARVPARTPTSVSSPCRASGTRSNGLRRRTRASPARCSTRSPAPTVCWRRSVRRWRRRPKAHTSRSPACRRASRTDGQTARGVEEAVPRRPHPRMHPNRSDRKRSASCGATRSTRPPWTRTRSDLVATRKLYDNGTLVQHSPSLRRARSGKPAARQPARPGPPRRH